MARGLKGAVAAAGVVALAAPATALAGGPIGGGSAGGLFYYVGNTNLPSNGLTGRTTICSEPNTRVIGGGFDSDNGSADGFTTLSSPIDAGDEDSKPDDGWYEEARNVRGMDTTLSSYAICGFDAVKYKTASRTLKAQTTGAVKVACPNGTRGTAGGLQEADTNGIRMSGLYPIDNNDAGTKPDDGWAVKATNFDFTPATVTVAAVCAVGVKMVYREDVGGLAHIDPNSTLGLSATTCPDNGFVTGGGARPVNPLSAADASITAMVPADTAFDGDAIPDDRLSFEETNDNPAVGGDLHFYTACLVRP